MSSSPESRGGSGASREMSPLAAIEEEMEPSTSMSLQSSARFDVSHISDVSSCATPSRVENESACVTSSGLLDLSDMQLSSLNKRFWREYSSVRHLVLNNNSFSSVSGLDKFKQCSEVSMVGNTLHKLSSLLPLAGRLVHLDASQNRLSCADVLRTFTLIETVNLSENHIQSFPVLELSTLALLDLSHNHIVAFPNLAKTPNLKVLNLAGNRVECIGGVREHLPPGIEQLLLADNLLTDPSELSLLAPFSRLVSVSVHGNPGIGSECDWRAYLCAVMGQRGDQTLEVIDGTPVTERDALRGEGLLSHARILSFKPGSGPELRAAIRMYCATGPGEHRNASFEANVEKVMAKRREMLDSSMAGSVDGQAQGRGHAPRALSVATSIPTEDEMSTHSPFSQWSRQLRGKENMAPVSSESDSARDGGEEKQRGKKNLFRLYPAPVGLRGGTPLSVRSEGGEGGGGAVPGSSGSSTMSAGSMASSTITLTGEEAVEEEGERACTPVLVPVAKPRRLAPSVVEKENSLERRTRQEAAVTIQRWWRSAIVSLRAEVAAIVERQEKELAEAEQRVEEMEVEMGEEEEEELQRTFDLRVQRIPSVTEGEVRRRLLFSDDEGESGEMERLREMERNQEALLARVRDTEANIDELRVQNERLTETNDQLSEILVHMQKEFQREMGALRALVVGQQEERQKEKKTASAMPRLSDLKLKALSSSSVEVKWKASSIKGYEVLVDGECCGVVGKEAATVSDLSPGRHRVEVRAVAWSGETGDAVAVDVMV